MIDEARIEQLARLQSDDGILSLYLRFEPRLMYDRGLALTKFKSAYQRFVRREASEKKKAAARRERDRIEEFLADWRPEGRGLVIFACEPAGIWEVISLAVSPPPVLSVNTTTLTRPLTMVLDEFPRLLVCVVQRDKATFYVSEQREAKMAASVVSEVPGKHSTGGWSQARFQRHTEVHVDKHLQEAVAAIEKIHKDQPLDRLILGGTTEMTSETERLLPENLRSRLVESVTINTKQDSEDDILAKAQAANEKAERKEEEELVRTVVDRAESGGRGAIGLDETLHALVDGRIEKLLLTEDLVKPGWQCTECDYVTETETDRCIVCGSEVESTSNIVDVAVEHAFLNGAGVEFVFEGPAQEVLSARGGIGALLRY